jgi:hypothetical protein
MYDTVVMLNSNLLKVFSVCASDTNCETVYI